MTGLGGRETPEKLEVLTLNTWGLWIVSKKRWRRMQHLARALAASTAVRPDHMMITRVFMHTTLLVLSGLFAPLFAPSSHASAGCCAAARGLG
jgi:hypothetical protein